MAITAAPVRANMGVKWGELPGAGSSDAGVESGALISAGELPGELSGEIAGTSAGDRASGAPDEVAGFSAESGEFTAFGTLTGYEAGASIGALTVESGEFTTLG